MAIEMMTRVWKYSRHKESKLLLLLAIADYANEEGFAWPSLKQLASRIRTGQRQTQYLLRDLEKSGELVTALRAGPDLRNGYQITVLEEKRFGGGAAHCTTRQTEAPMEDAVVDDTKVVQSTAPPDANEEMQGGAVESHVEEETAPCSPVHQGGAVQCTRVVQSTAPQKKTSLKQPVKKQSVTARARKPRAPTVFDDPLLTVTQKHDDRLADAFPWVTDRQLQYKQAALWLEAHDRKARRPLAFLLGWFKREPGPNVVPVGRTPVERELQAGAHRPEVRQSSTTGKPSSPFEEDRDPLDQARWQRLVGVLEEQLDPGIFDTWVRQFRLARIDGTTATIAAPAPVFAEWWQENIDVAAVCQRAAADISRIELVTTGGAF